METRLFWAIVLVNSKKEMIPHRVYGPQTPGSSVCHLSFEQPVLGDSLSFLFTELARRPKTDFSPQITPKSISEVPQKPTSRHET